MHRDVSQAAGRPPAGADRVVFYRPNQRHDEGFFRTWVAMADNVYRARELMWQLFKRDFFAAYKKSFIGIAWVFLTPLVGIASWVFLQRTGLLRTGDVGIPYPVYVLVGSSMWGLFTRMFGAASSTLNSGSAWITQVSFPHEAMLFKQTGQQLANFTITFALNIVVILAFGVRTGWAACLLPLVALPLFFLSAAIGLMAGMIGIVAVDVSRIVGIALRLLMYATPIVYSDKVDSVFVQTLNRWNPLTYLICSCRDIVVYGRLYDVHGYFVCALASVVLFVLSWRLFYVSENKIVERMI